MKIAAIAMIFALASVLVAQKSASRHHDEPVKSAKELAERMNAYYQAQFADLTLAKKGMFGLSRVESSNINGHTRSGSDGGYDVPGYSTWVTIYGNHGAQLATNAEDRFHRLPSGTYAGETIAPLALRDGEMERFVKSAIQKVNAGETGAAMSSGVWTIFARPVRLTRKECLSCHKTVKSGEAVALMVFGVGKKQRKSP